MAGPPYTNLVYGRRVRPQAPSHKYSWNSDQDFKQKIEIEPKNNYLVTRSGFGWARFEFRPARLRLDCFLGRLIGWLAGWLEGCLHDLLVGRSGSIARGTFPSEVQRRFPVGGGVLEACGSEFKARNSKLEGRTRKDFVVSNHSIVSRSTCEGTRRVHPHARMPACPGRCTRRCHPHAREGFV